MTGFRVDPSGAQGLYGIRPDLTTLGKVIGGGLPVGAYGGRQDIMEMVAPVGPMYQAGTLSGNPLAMVAGIETLKLISADKWQSMLTLAHKLDAGIADAAKQANIPIFQTRVGSMSGMSFTEQQVVDYKSAKSADTQRYAQFFHGMLANGVYLAPSQFEAAFMSMAHSDADVVATTKAVEKSLSKLSI